MLLNLQAHYRVLDFLCSFGTDIQCVALMFDLIIQTDVILFHYCNGFFAKPTDTLSADFFEEILNFPSCLKSSAPVFHGSAISGDSL